MLRKRSSSNIIDARSPRAKDIYVKSQATPMNALRNQLNSYNSNVGPSRRQIQTAKKLGLEGNLADLQNTANQMQAQRRTRMNNIDSPPLEYLIKRKKRI